MQAMLSRAISWINAPVPPENLARRTFAWIALGALVGVTYLAFSRAINHTARIEAAGEKDVAIKSVDSAENFGRVWVDREAKVISWNRGMSEIVGWTSKEMVSQTMERLDPHADGDIDSAIVRCVFSRLPEPWVAEGYMFLLTKDGEEVYVRVTVNDPTTSRYRELTFYRAERMVPLEELPLQSEPSP